MWTSVSKEPMRPVRFSRIGVVLDVFAADFPRTFDGEFHGVAQAADREFAAFEGLADDVDGGVVFVLFSDKGNL
jgi:hypothetical protein